MQTTDQKTMVNLTIDGIAVSVPKGTTVYTASKQLGIEIPIFCYHDRMPPFGACRQCLVEVEKVPKLQTSCTLEATEGMVVTTQNKKSVDGRESILELLLINHPLDCPICDKGGECPLQDQALKYGPGLSRFFEDKRRFKKPIPLGPVLMLDRERCVVCARCTRFSDIVSGDNALELLDRGFKTEVGTPGGGPAESKFIGNTIMICPVGALTSRVYRFRARPWDNEPTESTCTLCPVGCSMILDSRDGEVMRTRSCENKDINDIWLCDKGWFGYEYTDSPERLLTPLIRRNGNLEAASWDEALSLIASKISESKAAGKLGALGGNPLTNEENYLFQKLMREVIGVNHVDHRVGSPIVSLNEEGLAPGMDMQIGDCEQLSYAVLLGLDLTEEFPVIWLRLKQAINKGAKVVFIGNFAPEITHLISQTVLHAPGQELETLKKHLPELAKLSGKGALFVGSQYLANANRKIILSELAQFVNSNENLSLNIMEGRGNSQGARLAGMHPELGPNGQRLNNSGLDAVQMMENASRNGWDFLHVAGANPAKKYPSKLWQEVRSKLKFLVVQDLFLTETAQQADVVLPTLSFVEKSGHFLNISGHFQTLRPGKAIPSNIYSDGKIFIHIAQKLGHDISADVKLELQKREFPKDESQPRKTLEQKSGTILASFAPQLFDNGVRMKHNPHVIELAKEPLIRISQALATKKGIKNDSSAKIIANGNFIIGKAKIDNVADNTVVLPLGFDKLAVNELGVNLLNGLHVDLQSV